MSKGNLLGGLGNSLGSFGQSLGSNLEADQITLQTIQNARQDLEGISGFMEYQSNENVLSTYLGITRSNVRLPQPLRSPFQCPSSPTVEVKIPSKEPAFTMTRAKRKFRNE